MLGHRLLHSSNNMSLSKLVKDWRVKVFAVGRTKFLADREASFTNRHELEEFLGSLDSRPLSEPKYLHEAAKELADFLDDEMMSTPIGQLKSTLCESDPFESTSQDRARSMGIARYHIPRLWKKLKRDALYEYKIPTRVRERFLENVTLSNLVSQDVFKEYFVRGNKDFEYKLVVLVHSNINKRHKLRTASHTHEDEKRMWVNPHLIWLVDEIASMGRVDELIEQISGLGNDLKLRFVPENEANQAFDSTRLKALTHNLTWSFEVEGYFHRMGLASDVVIRHEIQRQVRSRAEALLEDIDVVANKDEFLKRLTLEPVPRPAKRLDEHIGPTLRYEAIEFARTDIHRLKASYEDLVAHVRKRRATLQEGLLRLDKLWGHVIHDIDAQFRDADLVRRKFVLDNGQSEKTSFESAFASVQLQARANTVAVSVRMAMGTLNKLLTAATRPPSTLASLTHGYDWRAQVKKAAKEAETSLDWLHPSTEEWIDGENKAANDAEADLKALSERWSKQLADLAQAQHHVVEEMNIVHEAWQSTGRHNLVQDLFKSHIARLQRVPATDHMPRSWIRSMLDQWEPATGPWWSEEQLVLYNRVRVVNTNFVPWSDLQTCLLMRQTELSTMNL